MSSTSSGVVLAWVDAKGLLLPDPRWSNSITLNFFGLKKRRSSGLHPPPGPPWTNRIGFPRGLPTSS